MHCHLPAATHNVRSHWMSPADGPASPSCTRAMPQAVAVAYTASTLGAAARCSKSTSFLPLMPLSRLVARHSRMLSRSYGGRVCGAVACVWPVLTRLLSVPCLGHKNRTRGAAQGPSKPRNRQMSQPGSPRAGPSRNGENSFSAKRPLSPQRIDAPRARVPRGDARANGANARDRRSTGRDSNTRGSVDRGES